MRRYLRTLFNDIFKNNIFVKIITKIVNFYCDLFFKTENTLKFEPNMSITELREKNSFSFHSVTGDEIDCK